MMYSQGMANGAFLHQALRSVAELRDKFVVLRLEAGALDDAERVSALSAPLALLRQLGIRVVVLLGPTDVQAHAVRLMRGISRHGQRALMMPAAGVITVNQPLPAGPAAPLPGLPVLVDQVLLVQFCSLGYIPLLLLPVVDENGAAISVSADDVAAAAALFLDAALLVFVRNHKPKTPIPLPAITVGRRTHQTSASELSALLSDLLLTDTPKVQDPSAPPAPARSRRGKAQH